MNRYVDDILFIYKGEKMDRFIDLFETSDFYPRRGLTVLGLKRIAMEMEKQLRNNHTVISNNNPVELAKLYKQFKVQMEGFYLRHPEKYLNSMNLLTLRETNLIEGIFDCFQVTYFASLEKMVVGWKRKLSSKDIIDLFLNLNEEFIEINFPTYSFRSHFLTDQQKLSSMQQNFSLLIQNVLIETDFEKKYQCIVREVYGEFEESIPVDSSGKKRLY
ncbi:hypothetical protein [Bacillus toyonensis]|uniref:hypothetical protein n=1 Tax=Bacillus toyonensis TaxID=155322 RepID=UPI002E220404|nr:hypothetical protein [Bacillus toyonensis]